MQRILRYFLVFVAVLLASVPISVAAQEKLGSVSRPIHLGVMLPLNNSSSEGVRMIEYYRGMLMACDSLRKLGVSVEVNAWNVTEFTVISKLLDQPQAATLDLLVGPYYSNKLQPLSDFVLKHNIMLVVPFAVNTPEVTVNPRIFQIHQSPAEQNSIIIRQACNWFKDYHPVIIDCADAESTKGSFTSGLREAFKDHKIKYSLTSLSSPENKFVKAFEKDQRNVVIINSARLSCLTNAFEKLKALRATRPELQISMLGYSEWLSSAAHLTQQFHQFDVYLPSPSYANPSAAITERLQQKYRWNFHEKMLAATPSFALDGFDHTFFFLRGLYKYGKTFDGAGGRFGYPSVQTPLSFVRVGKGGYQNRAGILVHYTQTGRIETIKY